jgi:hypothetical protein
MTTDPTTELTEDDIFRMKKLATTPSEVADQSAASVADSSSIGNDAGVDDGETVNGGSVDGDAAISAAVREEVKMREMGDDVLPPQLPRNYIVSGDYVFGRHRPVSPQLNRETVTALTFPFEPLIIPGEETLTVAGPKRFSPPQIQALRTRTNTENASRSRRSTLLGLRISAQIQNMTSSTPSK